MLLIGFEFVYVLTNDSRALASFLRLEYRSLELGFPTWVCGYTLFDLRFVLCKWRLFDAGRGSAGLPFGGTVTAHNVFKTLSVQHVVVFSCGIGSGLV